MPKNIIYLALLLLSACAAPKDKSMKTTETTTTDTTNPLLCDIETGACAMPTPANKDSQNIIKNVAKSLKIIYFTDPICSSCWGIEPQLRRLKLEYGADIDIEYRMGGLLPDWSYNSGGISKPSDVAHHWDEVSLHYDMPIDGDVWLEDPLDSSYPPSIAFKAAQMQDNKKAILFLRRLRELLFLQKRNVCRWEYVQASAAAVGLDTAQLRKDFDGPAQILFREDLDLARKMNVRGFPTLFFVGESGQSLQLYGARAYSVFQQAIAQTAPKLTAQPYGKTWEALFAQYPSLTAREFAELSGTERRAAEQQLLQLVAAGKLSRLQTKNGSLYFSS